MRAGDHRHRLKIQRRDTTQDASGAPSENWIDVATVWAAIAPLSGRELMTAQSIKSDVSHMISVRYRPLFADPAQVAALRGTYKSQIFNFTAALNIDERNREVQIMASEGMNNG